MPAAEWDFEFLTNDKWITSPDSGQVTMNYHLDDNRSKIHYQELAIQSLQRVSPVRISLAADPLGLDR